jgi:Ankyrin repeats (many copies)
MSSLATCRYSCPVPADAALMTLLRAIVAGDHAYVSELLTAAPELATQRLAVGASRDRAEEYFLAAIDHHVYAGDTALHIAAAAYEPGLARELVDAGALTTAANRRGAQPLHYAVDGVPGSARWNPTAQEETVRCLVELGADLNAVDQNGTTPLHRAVRNRCAAAVAALLDLGADPTSTNRRGSTLMQLARATTGRGGSGSAHARAQQQEIVRLLLSAGVARSRPALLRECGPPRLR